MLPQVRGCLALHIRRSSAGYLHIIQWQTFRSLHPIAIASATRTSQQRDPPWGCTQHDNTVWDPLLGKPSSPHNSLCSHTYLTAVHIDARGNVPGTVPRALSFTPQIHLTCYDGHWNSIRVSGSNGQKLPGSKMHYAEMMSGYAIIIMFMYHVLLRGSCHCLSVIRVYHTNPQQNIWTHCEYSHLLSRGGGTD